MTDMTPPIADQRPHQFEHHGITVSDPYHWLRDPSYPTVDDADVLAYLNAENAYFEAMMAPREELVETLFQEMKGRIKEDDASVPARDGDYLYWRAFEKGAQYRKWWRRPVTGGPDQLLLDEPALAEGHEYFSLGAMDVSPDDRLLAYATDTNGSERYVVRVRDLSNGKLLPDAIPGMKSAIVWSADSSGFFYGNANDNWRTDTIFFHRLGDDPANDRVVYREVDDGFQLSVGMTQSRRFVTIEAGDQVTSEIRLISTDQPDAEPLLVKMRQPGVSYSVEEHDGTLFIHTNDTDTQFRLVTATLDRPGEWQERIAPSRDFYMTDVTTFADFFVVEGRENGLDQVYIHRYPGGEPVRVAFDEASYVTGLDENPEYAVDTLRLNYQSMVTPGTVLEYRVADGTQMVLKVAEIPSGYNPEDYATERVTIRARDGAEVPVSIVYRKSFARDGTQPLHLYAYGAYGYAIPPGFSTGRLSLLDRGFAYAIAHIRGGDDLGYQWYLDGKLEKRTNSFNDFVDVGRGLIERGYTSAGRLTASGGSAGGELMGAVVNQAPELFGAVAAHVPFVDVLSTMLDDSLPLTPGEWPEWGNPITDKAAFELIRSYSPYDQVKAQDYPPLLITGGLNDPRVTYWEPAKWAARLRATKTDDHFLLLKTNMGAGHGGKSGRFESLREDAEEQAFLLWQLGMAD